MHTFTCDEKLDLKLQQNLREQNLTTRKNTTCWEDIEFFPKVKPMTKRAFKKSEILSRKHQQ